MKRGLTLLEVLLALVVSTAAMVVAYQTLVTYNVGVAAASEANQSAAQTQQSLDTIADHLRNAQVCTSSSAGILNSAVSAASATSVTYYGTSACAPVTYALSGTTLKRTDGTTTSVVYNVTSLTLTYYKATTYNTAWTTTTNPNAPTTAELPLIAGILIDVVTNSNGVTNEITTTVRLRNSPVKANLNGL